MKRNLFFDLDGMKFNTIDAQISYINHRYDISIKKSDLVQNGTLDLIIKKYLPDLDMTKDEIYKDLGENFASSIKWHRDVLPMKDMCKVIFLLSKKYTLWTVTARQNSGINVINYLLNKYIPNCISGVHCVWTLTENGTFDAISKRDFIQSIEGEKIAFFDDSPHEVGDTKDIVQSYLFDPTNKYEDIEGIIRLKSWNEIGKIFL